VDLERVIASECRRRIIATLRRAGRIHVMLLIRRVNSNYSQVNPNLLILAREGIILEERLGHKRIIWLNRNNPKTDVLLQVLDIFDKFSNEEQNIRNQSKRLSEISW
jgi:hypothetical protein